VGRPGIEPGTYGLKERPAAVRTCLASSISAGQADPSIHPHPRRDVVGRGRGCHHGCQEARERCAAGRQNGPLKCDRPGSRADVGLVDGTLTYHSVGRRTVASCFVVGARWGWGYGLPSTTSGAQCGIRPHDLSRHTCPSSKSAPCRGGLLLDPAVNLAAVRRLGCQPLGHEALRETTAASKPG